VKQFRLGICFPLHLISLFRKYFLKNSITEWQVSLSLILATGRSLKSTDKRYYEPIIKVNWNLNNILTEPWPIDACTIPRRMVQYYRKVEGKVFMIHCQKPTDSSQCINHLWMEGIWYTTTQGIIWLLEILTDLHFSSQAKASIKEKLFSTQKPQGWLGSSEEIIIPVLGIGKVLKRMHTYYNKHYNCQLTDSIRTKRGRCSEPFDVSASLDLHKLVGSSLIEKAKTSKPTKLKAKLKVPLSQLTDEYRDIPVKRIEAYINRSPEDRNAEVPKDINGVWEKLRIPSPMGAFELYQWAYADRAKLWGEKNSHPRISSVARRSWYLESINTRYEYLMYARIEYYNHNEAHNYPAETPSTTRIFLFDREVRMFLMDS
jgi:hypothetical protein